MSATAAKRQRRGSIGARNRASPTVPVTMGSVPALRAEVSAKIAQGSLLRVGEELASRAALVAEHEIVLTANGRELSLTATEYLILELLMRRSPMVVDRKSIAEHAWADETDPLGSNAIDVQMSRLRGKLPDAAVHIVTVRGAGYRLDEA